MNTLAVYAGPEKDADTALPDPHGDIFSKNVLGFWIYLMTDCILFTTLFATYAVLHSSTFGGPGPKDLFRLDTAFVETMVLLLSSVTCGLGLLFAVREKPRLVFCFLSAAFLFGASFVALELREFTHLVAEGHSWRQSAFLSSFFTLVGTHGAHVSTGLIWLAVMLGQLLLQGITAVTFRRLVIFSLFWHFLDLVWIFIFTFVYLLGVI